MTLPESRRIRSRIPLRRRLLAAPFVVAGAGLLGGSPGVTKGTAGTREGTGEDPQATVTRRVSAMGTLLEILVSAPTRPTALRASEAAFGAIQRAEDRLSTWRRDTRLARLNAAPPGEARAVDGGLLRLLAEVSAWSSRTEGAFDPAVGALVDLYDLRGSGHRPTARELAAARTATGLRCFRIDPPRERVTRVCPGAWIDAGAFGKGAALRDAAAALRRAGATSARLDFGGQLLFLGPPPREGRVVEVAHPRARTRTALSFQIPQETALLETASVATTAQSERSVDAGGRRVGHVLDPRTGLPVEDWGSVTVVSADPLEADVLSTALFVLGPELGPAWAEREGVTALFLRSAGNRLLVEATGALRGLPGGDGCSRGAEETGAGDSERLGSGDDQRQTPHPGVGI